MDLRLDDCEVTAQLVECTSRIFRSCRNQSARHANSMIREYFLSLELMNLHHNVPFSDHNLQYKSRIIALLVWQDKVPAVCWTLFVRTVLAATTTFYDLVHVADKGESRYKLTEFTGRNTGPVVSIRFYAHGHSHSGRLIRLKRSLTPPSEGRAVEVLDIFFPSTH
jgi:hypothetical protein